MVLNAEDKGRMAIEAVEILDNNVKGRIST